MRKETIDTFSKLKQKAAFCAPSADAELNRLSSMIDSRQKRCYHVGSGHNVYDFDYHFIEWDGRAAVAVKQTSSEDAPNYVFFEIKVEDGVPVSVDGIYSTIISHKAERFNGEMGCVGSDPSNPEMEEAAKDDLIFGMLYEALTARIKAGEN